MRQAKYYNRGSKAKVVLPEGQTVRFKVSDDADEWQKGEIARALRYRAYQSDCQVSIHALAYIRKHMANDSRLFTNIKDDPRRDSSFMGNGAIHSSCKP